MVRVVGPLHSDRASGQFGKTAIYSRALGQNICRAYTYNNNLTGSVVLRSKAILSAYLQVFENIKRFGLRAAYIRTFVSPPIVDFFERSAGLGQSWQQVLAGWMYGKGFSRLDRSLARYAGLDSFERDSWDVWAGSDLVGVSSRPYPGGTGDRGEIRLVLEEALLISGYVGQVYPYPAPCQLLPFPARRGRRVAGVVGGDSGGVDDGRQAGGRYAG